MWLFGAFAPIFVDETKDISKKEQLKFVLWIVDKDYEIYIYIIPMHVHNIYEHALECFQMTKSNAQR